MAAAILGSLGCAVAAGGRALLRRGTRWGSTPGEQAMALPGDDYLAGGPGVRATMTRAITIDAPPAVVWPWLAQLGRGAGYYSIDRLDNGDRTSARHVVSWIPEPTVGDATALGYLRRVEPGVGVTWWMPGDRFLGAWARMAFDIQLRPSGDGSRVVVRVSADARGLTACPAMLVFRIVDSIMARRQLLGLRQRVTAPTDEGDELETGARDQYQRDEVIYAGGGGAGVPGREKGSAWRDAAVADGVV